MTPPVKNDRQTDRATLLLRREGSHERLETRVATERCPHRVFQQVAVGQIAGQPDQCFDGVQRAGVIPGPDLDLRETLQDQRAT